MRQGTHARVLNVMGAVRKGGVRKRNNPAFSLSHVVLEEGVLGGHLVQFSHFPGQHVAMN